MDEIGAMPDAGEKPVAGASPHWSIGSMPRPPERPAHVLVRMLGWALLALGAVFLLNFLIAFVLAVSKLGPQNRNAVVLPQSVIMVCSVVATQGVYLWGAIRRAKITGWRGDLAGGLGFYRTQRWGLLIVLCSLVLISNGLVWFARTHLPAAQFTPEVFPFEVAFASAGTTTRTILALLSIFVAPVAEELFFRGWLWTALRLFWTPLPVMIVTGCAWVAVHMTDDVHLVPRLLPLALILGIVRHFGRSVVASIGLHMVNNAIVSAELLAIYG